MQARDTNPTAGMRLVQFEFVQNDRPRNSSYRTLRDSKSHFAVCSCIGANVKGEKFSKSKLTITEELVIEIKKRLCFRCGSKNFTAVHSRIGRNRLRDKRFFKNSRGLFD